MLTIPVREAPKIYAYNDAHQYPDGGFFVFPDLSVKIEGQFRLRFSLFDMGK